MRRRTAPMTATLALVVGLLAACDAPEETPAEPGIEASAPTGGETVTDLAPDEPSLSPGEDASPEPFAADDAALTALTTAESVVEGGRAFELDRGDDDGEGTWEVHVAAGGTDHEIHVSPDGSAVVSEESEDDLDAEDAERLDAASVAATEAGFNAMSEVTGTVEEVDLDAEGGDVVWKIEVRTADGADVDVVVDAVTGEIR